MQWPNADRQTLPTVVIEDGTKNSGNTCNGGANGKSGWNWKPNDGQGQTHPDDYRLQSVSHLKPPYDYPCNPARFLIQGVTGGFIPEAGVSMITSAPSQGKSMVSLAMANAIANGFDFAGMQTRQQPVAYFDRENPQSAIIERSVSLDVHYGNLKLWHGRVFRDDEVERRKHPIFDPPPGPFDLRVLDYTDACEPKPLLIFDSFIAFLRDGGGNENDSADIRAYMDGFRVLANKGASVLIIHHAGKGEGNKIRGSSDILASLDSA